MEEGTGKGDRGNVRGGTGHGMGRGGEGKGKKEGERKRGEGLQPQTSIPAPPLPTRISCPTVYQRRNVTSKSVHNILSYPVHRLTHIHTDRP